MSTPLLSEYRALIVHDRIPPGLFPVPIEDGRFDPHLLCGEWALVDPSDREIQWGELYLLWMTSRAIVFQVLPVNTVFGRIPEEPHAYITHLNLWAACTSDLIPVPLLQEKIIGRVIAILDDPLDRLHRRGRAA